MKTAPYIQVAVVGFAGLALAGLGKLTYDLFNGYAVIPNLFLVLGFVPPPVMLEALLILSLVCWAFALGTVLLRITAISPRLCATLAAVPWLASSLPAIAAVLQDDHGQALLASAPGQPERWASLLLPVLAIPAGIWLGMRRHPPQRRPGKGHR